MSKDLLSQGEDPLIGFDWNPSFPKGHVSLPVTTIGKLIQVNFMVVEAKLAYNAILGRKWIHKWKGSPQPCIRFFVVE